MAEEETAPSASVIRNRAYCRKWYAKSKEALNEKRRARYREDPEYRAKAIARANKKRPGKKTKKKKRYRRKIKAVDILKKYRKGMFRKVDTTYLMDIGSMSKMLERDPRTIRRWEAAGLIPTPFRNSRGQRGYTMEVATSIIYAFQNDPRLRSGPRAKSPVVFPVQVLDPDGTARVEAMYGIRHLASTLGCSMSGARQLERSGLIPRTPFRDPASSFRYYTGDMLLAVRESMGRVGVLPGHIGSSSPPILRDAIIDAWVSQGVLGKKILKRISINSKKGHHAAKEVNA